MKLVKFFYLTLGIFLATFVSAEEPVVKNKFGVGITYPGLSIKYFLSEKLAIEGRGQFIQEDDVKAVIGGVRGYYNFISKNKLSLFTGMETDYISFDTDESKGKGYAGEVFVGTEYFFGKTLSIQIDMGPAWVRLKDNDTSVKDSGVEYIMNLGLNWYFSGGSK